MTVVIVRSYFSKFFWRKMIKLIRSPVMLESEMKKLQFSGV